LIFTREFLRAVSDWQRGGGLKQKQRRGERLKDLSQAIDARFRQCGLVTYRQVALGKGPLWKLLAEKRLPETISAWTLSPEIAKTFKGGVPPEDWHGVIVALKPPEGSVVLNLDTLYRDHDFLEALEQEKGVIEGYSDGAGRYGATQHEVVLEIDSLENTNIHAIGGYSSDRDTLIRMMFGQEPTPELIAWFEDNRKKAGIELGAMWLEGEPLQRALARVEPHIPGLKAVKAMQAAEAAKEKSQKL
jgi:hypothetical protein